MKRVGIREIGWWPEVMGVGEWERQGREELGRARRRVVRKRVGELPVGGLKSIKEAIEDARVEGASIFKVGGEV